LSLQVNDVAVVTEQAELGGAVEATVYFWSGSSATEASFDGRPAARAAAARAAS
jgi:hypothetical protein